MLAWAALLLLTTARASPDYAGIIREVEALHAPRLAARGLTLRIVETRQGVNAAHSDIRGEEAILGVDAGVYASGLTEGAFRFMLCHELGHLSGTAPRRPAPMDWTGPVGADGLMLLSDEGQADYWAARECMPELVGGDPDRVAQAGLEFLHSMAIQVPISYATPSPEMAAITTIGYPSRQCRLDTIAAGASGGPRPRCWFAD